MSPPTVWSAHGDDRPPAAATHACAKAEGRLAKWLAERVDAEFSRPLTRTVQSTEPDDRRARIGQALRAFRLGMEEAAFAMMFDLVKANPGWEEGHTSLAQMLAETGAAEAFELFLFRRVEHCGNHVDIMALCLRMLSDAGLHGSVQALLPLMRARLGDHMFFTLLDALAASETGELDRADALFARAAIQDDGLSLPHITHQLRRGRAQEAAALAEAFVALQPDNQVGWCLLETAWRMLGDARNDWLIGQPGLIGVRDLAIADEIMSQLSEYLRALHVARSHPFDQSLRGGTQTGGYLLRSKDTEIRLIRQLLTGAIREHINQLPPRDPKHPLLKQRRDSFHFADSWSVRLLDGGWHVSHCHSMGMLSSAFYVTLPPPCPVDEHAGWLMLGAPPEELGTGLRPMMMVEPRVARLAVFPSFLWHGTRPFPRGERMTIAFDTVLTPPRFG